MSSHKYGEALCGICGQPKLVWEDECFHCSIGCGPTDLKASVRCRETVAVDKEDLKTLIKKNTEYMFSTYNQDPYDGSHILNELDKFLKKYGKNI